MSAAGRVVPSGAITIRRAGSDQLDEAVDVLATAFCDYPWIRWTVQAEERARRVHDMYRTIVTEMVHPHGRLWVAVDGDGHVLGAAGWLTPTSAPPDDVLARVEQRISALRGDRADAAASAEHAVAARRLRDSHWYLGAVAVDAEARRRGLGRALLEPGLRAAQRDRVPAVLETSLPGNVEFYNGLGFELYDHVQLSSGGPPVWCMRRDPT